MKQSKEKVNVHSILPESRVNGPGKRFVIWVQGCIFSCKGCFNNDLLPFVPKNLMSIEEIMNEIPLSRVEGVTISGGEPFCQAEVLCMLAQAITASGLSLMAYTGYEYRSLLESGNDIFHRFLTHIDILVDGPYDENIKPDTVWAGSGNQNVLFLTDRYAYLKDDIFIKGRYTEYHIGNDGLLKATGF
ncbi:MAG: radical SAM protein [Spirochaetales bacterium]|nr:radical SAM protein [Spirochaetales bacterium]